MFCAASLLHACRQAQLHRSNAIFALPPRHLFSVVFLLFCWKQKHRWLFLRARLNRLRLIFLTALSTVGRLNGLCSSHSLQDKCHQILLERPVDGRAAAQINVPRVWNVLTLTNFFCILFVHKTNKGRKTAAARWGDSKHNLRSCRQKPTTYCIFKHNWNHFTHYGRFNVYYT